MNAFATIAALTGVLAAGIIYGTDVFCALVQRSALARLDDATMAAAIGRVHQYGDRRLPAPGVTGILAAAAAIAAAAVSGSPASATAAGIDAWSPVNTRAPKNRRRNPPLNRRPFAARREPGQLLLARVLP